jgi:hypothetical protein
VSKAREIRVMLNKYCGFESVTYVGECTITANETILYREVTPGDDYQRAVRDVCEYFAEYRSGGLSIEGTKNGGVDLSRRVCEDIAEHIREKFGAKE